MGWHWQSRKEFSSLVEGAAASVKAVHGGGGDAVDLETGWVDFTLAVGAGGGSSGGGVAVVAHAGTHSAVYLIERCKAIG